MVEEGQTVILDAGAELDGYCSDCTRTFAAGRLDGELREAYDVCLQAQLAGLDAVRPGVSGVEADAAARRVIEDAGHGERFGHGLGHGVGMDVHELPRLSRESKETLAVRNVTSVEPGIYLPGPRRHPDRRPRGRPRRRAGAADDVHQGARHARLSSRPRFRSSLDRSVRWA